MPRNEELKDQLNKVSGANAQLEKEVPIKTPRGAIHSAARAFCNKGV